MINLVSIPIDIRGLHHTSSNRRLFRGRKFDEGAALHRFIRETFGADAFSTFRLMKPSGSITGTLYGYSKSSADELREIANTAGVPDSADIFRLASIKSTPRPQNAWSRGQRLGLSIKSRTTRRSSLVGTQTTEKGRREAEVDAYLHDLAAYERGILESKSTREFAYQRWLTEKLTGEQSTHREAIASINIGLDEITQNDVFRQGKWCHGPDVIFGCDIEVGDPEKFAQLLQSGVGRHKSYGYGMVLVTQVRQQN